MKKWLLILFLFAGTNVFAQNLNIDLKDLNGKYARLNEHQGEKLTVIDFWATWCKPCIAAIPKISKLSDEFKDDGVVFWGINIDSPRNQAKVKPFVKSMNISYPVFLDGDQELMSDLNVHAVPTLIVLDAKGKVRFFHEGFQPGDEEVIQEEIQNLLTKLK